jgi:hypothetical protein
MQRPRILSEYGCVVLLAYGLGIVVGLVLGGLLEAIWRWTP